MAAGGPLNPRPKRAEGSKISLAVSPIKRVQWYCPREVLGGSNAPRTGGTMGGERFVRTARFLSAIRSQISQGTLR
ncbi:hypothetical protein SAMN05444166_2643 [Singulisphaera sp. GP187]|nr:hypothetical protein SAMN05444166_2643 [Singulisphaera sp. GP187]